MINGAGSVKQDHADDENGYSRCGKAAGCECGFGDQRKGGSHCKDHSDEVGQSAAGIFDVKFHVVHLRVKTIWIKYQELYNVVLKTMCCNIIYHFRKNYASDIFFVLSQDKGTEEC